MGDEGEWKDLMSNGAVLKQVARESPIEPKVAPDYKQEVTVHVVGRTQTEPKRVFTDTRATNSPITTIVGENILDLLPPGLMLILRTMSVGEVARARLASRFAFGLGASWLGIEADTDVEYEIELLKVGDFSKEIPEMTIEEMEAKVSQFKARGNEFFSFGELDKALRCYKEGVRYGDGALQHMDEQGKTISPKDKFFEDRVACLNNIATVLEKQGKLKEAMETTVQVLECDPRHLKSLLRAARIAIKQGSHEEAIAAVGAAVDVAPGNPVVLELKQDLAKRLAKYKQQEKERWGGFLKPVSKDVAEQLRQRQQEELENLKQEQEKATIESSEASPETDLPSTNNRSTGREEEADKGVEEKLRAVDENPSDDEIAIEGPYRTLFERIFTPDKLELLARLVVLLSPTLISVIAMLIWSIFAV